MGTFYEIWIYNECKIKVSEGIFVRAEINNFEFDENQMILKVNYKLFNSKNTPIGEDENIASWHCVNGDWKLLYPDSLPSKEVESIENALDEENGVRLHLVTNGFL